MEYISVNDIMATLRRRWFLIAIVALVGAVAAYIAVKTLMPTEWQTKTTLLLEPSGNTTSNPLLGLIPDLGGNESGTFVNILRSRTLRERVAVAADLANRFEVSNERAAGSLLATMYTVESRAGILTVSVTMEGPPYMLLSEAEEKQLGQLVSDIANTMASELQIYLETTDFTRASVRRKFLEDQLTRTDRELLAAEDALVAYATAQGMVSPASQSGAAVENLKQLRARELDLNVTIQGARETLSVAMADLSSQERLWVSSISEKRNPSLDRLHARVLDVQRQIAEEMEIQGKSEQHPDVQALILELAEVQAQIAGEVETEMYAGSQQLTVDPQYASLMQTVLNKQLEVSGLEAKLATVRSARGEALAEIEAIPAASTRYNQLQREIKLKTEAYQRLAQQYEAARVSEAAAVPKFAVLDDARPKKHPSGPGAAKFCVVGALAAAFFGTLLAFWLDFRRERAAQAAVA